MVLVAQQESRFGKSEAQVLCKPHDGERVEHCRIVATAAAYSLWLRENAKPLVISNR